MVVKRKRGLKTTSRRKKKQQLKDSQTDDRDWAGLPDYLIDLVIMKLPFGDCSSLSRVCKPWRSVSTKLLDGRSRGIPLLLNPSEIENITRMCLNVLDKNKNSSITRRFGGAYHDWLFLGRLFDKFNIHITLLNPFSGEKVVLPKTLDGYHTVVLSMVPSDSRCIYMLVHETDGVAFWTSGVREWRKCDFMDTAGVIEAIYHAGNFYLSRDNHEMLIINEKRVLDMLRNIDSGLRLNVLG